jgi:hypothetical protein
MKIGVLGKDRRGGIEGLPLQLMIIILIATMGSAVIMGWMGEIDSPHYIRSLGIAENVVTIEDGVIQDIHVCILDERGEPLQGASVLITNKQVTSDVDYVVTDQSGRAVLTGWKLGDYPKGTIRLNVAAYLAGYTERSEQIEGLIR